MPVLYGWSAKKALGQDFPKQGSVLLLEAGNTAGSGAASASRASQSILTMGAERWERKPASLRHARLIITEEGPCDASSCPLQP